MDSKLKKIALAIIGTSSIGTILTIFLLLILILFVPIFVIAAASQNNNSSNENPSYVGDLGEPSELGLVSPVPENLLQNYYFYDVDGDGINETGASFMLPQYYLQFQHGYGNHNGIDLPAVTGTPLIAPYDGVVMETTTPSTERSGSIPKMQIGGGNNIIFRMEFEQYPDKYFYFSLAHLNKILVNKGDVVKQGQQIGEIGATGNVTGPHLHLAMAVGTKEQPLSNALDQYDPMFLFKGISWGKAFPYYSGKYVARPMISDYLIGSR